jgi:hypothetical protein
MVDNNLAYLELYLSGGVDNVVPNSSLGGIKSNTPLHSKTVAWKTDNISGITLVDAPGSTDGDGSLAYNVTNKTLTWTPFSGSAGEIITLVEDGKYAISGSSGLLIVSVVFANLPLTDQTADVTVAQKINSLFDDITKFESFNGNTDYRCFYIYNSHPTDPFVNISIYISQQTTGSDNILIGLDPSGVGNGSTTGVATTILDETSIPTNVVFSSPSTIGTALVINQIAAGQAHAIWEKRVVPSGTLTGSTNDESTITIRAGY